MVKRSTWILLAILALAIGAYFIVKQHASKASKTVPTASPTNYLISSPAGNLQSLKITEAGGGVFQMQRDLSKTWVVTAPKTGTADQGLAGAADTQVGSLRILTTLDTPPDPNTTGLVTPSYTIEMGFADGKSHKIEVGNLTPTSSGYYVRLDGGKVYVIEQSGIDALTKLLSAPPFPPTPTPSPTVEATETPTP